MTRRQLDLKALFPEVERPDRNTSEPATLTFMDSVIESEELLDLLATWRVLRHQNREEYTYEEFLRNCPPHLVSLWTPAPSEEASWLEALELPCIDLDIPFECMAAYSLKALVGFENSLVRDVMTCSVRYGELETVHLLETTYQFSPEEVGSILMMSRSAMQGYFTLGPDAARAVTIAFLMDLIPDLKESLSNRDRLNAINLLARITGVTKTNPNDEVQDFMDAIRVNSQELTVEDEE